MLTPALHLIDDSPVPKSLGLSDRPTFTFIDHDEDLASKQITGANARKAIRSHVMRDVRRRERLAGRKRPSKRGERSGTDSAKSTGSSSPRKATPTSNNGKEPKDVKERTLLQVNSACSFSPSSSASPSAIEPSTDIALTSKLGGKGSVSWPTDSNISQEKIRELSAQLFDPFVSLPGADDLPYIIDALVQYCECYHVSPYPVIRPGNRSRVLFVFPFGSIGIWADLIHGQSVLRQLVYSMECVTDLFRNRLFYFNPVDVSGREQTF